MKNFLEIDSYTYRSY